MVATSELSVVGLACAVAAAVRAKRLAAYILGPRITDGTLLSTRAQLVAIDAELIRSAASIGSRHGLRTLDAVHVASALVLRDAAPTLVSWDDHQRRAAAREGLPVYP